MCNVEKWSRSLASQLPILLVLIDLHCESKLLLVNLYDPMVSIDLRFFILPGALGLSSAESKKHLTVGSQLLHAGQLADALAEFHKAIGSVIQSFLSLRNSIFSPGSTKFVIVNCHQIMLTSVFDTVIFMPFFTS